MSSSPAPPGPPEARDAASSGGDASQFVMFHVQDEKFAVPLEEVQEIIRMPDVVRVPMSPPAMEGLANLRGTVLPVINLREVFRFPTALHDDATRVVVLDQGRPVGLIVDRMANVTSVEAGPDRIRRHHQRHRGDRSADRHDQGHGRQVHGADPRCRPRGPPRVHRLRRPRRAPPRMPARRWRRRGAMPAPPRSTRTSWSASRSPARNTPSRSARCRRSCNCPTGSPRCRRRPAMCWA